MKTTEQKIVDPKLVDATRWGTIIAALAYGAWMIWWAAALDTKVAQVEKWIEANKNMPSIMAQFETQFESLGDKITYLSSQLEKYNIRMDEYLMSGRISK